MVRAWHVGLCRPGVGYDVIVPDEVNNCIGSIAPAGHVEVAIDHAERCATCRMRNRRPRSESISHGVVFPHIGLGAGDLPGVVAADQVDLAIGAVVARCHKRTHVRHVCSRAPRVGGNIIDPGRVAIHAAGGIFAAEHINLVSDRVINGGGHGRPYSWHGR